MEISEEFRRLTLQVIGESLMSLAPEESDRIFPHLYLPIMARLRPCLMTATAEPCMRRRSATAACWSRGAPTF